MSSRPSNLQIILPLSNLTSTPTPIEFDGSGKDLILSLNVTAQGGTTPTLDVTIEEHDGVNTWTQLAQFDFTQVGAATPFERIVADPNVAAERVHGSRLRAVITIAGGGGENYTFSLTAQSKNEN